MNAKMLLAIVVLLSLSVAACENGYSGGDEQAFSNPEELRAYLSQRGSASGPSPDMLMRNEMADGLASESGVAPTSSTRTDDVSFTGTNVQVEGVDEADILKTDGNHIYTIVGESVVILKSLPSDETQRIASIGLDWRPQGLFLKGEKLFIIGTERDTATYTVVSAYDVSDPEEPEELFENRIEGSYVTGRATENIYIVSQSQPDYHRPMPMPIILEGGVERHVAIDRIMLPRPVDNPRFVTVSEITDDGSIESTSVITEGYPTVYASHRSIHLAINRRVNEWTLRQDEMHRAMEGHLTDDDHDLIERIRGTDADILSPAEKRSKVNGVITARFSSLDRDVRENLQDSIEEAVKEELESHESFEYTDLIEVPYETLRAADPLEIRGSVNNQFSLDEHEGVLRVATTTNPRWSLGEGVDSMENHVYTIRDGQILDSVHGLAPSERIFSARYMGDRLYLVTFRQIDPFFTIDLSDPENIEVLGELKITGFSRYLHAYSDDVIIGLGREASPTGAQRGLKISLFNVSDPQRPREMTSWVSDERSVHSSAEWEHKAFLLDREHDLLAIPISSRAGWDRPIAGDTGRVAERSEGGALVFSISEGSIEARGIIAHPDHSGVERSLIIEDALYTKSRTLLRVHDLADLNELASVELYEEGDIPIR